MIPIFNSSVEDFLTKSPSDLFDLTVTSPPYDKLRNYNNLFNLDIICKESYRTTKQGGILVWVVNDQTKKGSETGTSFKQALKFIEHGWLLNDTMIWKKTNPMPQVKQPRYNQVFEYMFVFSKGKPKTFNPIMIPCKTAGQLYDSTTKVIDGGKTRIKKTFNINIEKYDDNIWEMAVAQNKTKHIAVFPEKLCERHILSWTNEGDLVCDFFLGSGTTLKVAKKLNRNFIGCDINAEYCELASETIYSL